MFKFFPSHTPVLMQGYYCPTPFNATPYTAQFICPAVRLGHTDAALDLWMVEPTLNLNPPPIPQGYYCPGNSTTYVDTPCQAGYWGPDGQTNSTCAGLCSLVPVREILLFAPLPLPSLPPSSSLFLLRAAPHNLRR